MVEKTQRAGLNWPRLGLRLAGAGLLAATGAIHLDLYLTGYRSIPVIGQGGGWRSVGCCPGAAGHRRCRGEVTVSG